MELSVTVTIISSLISGIVGVVISTIYQRRYERHRMKVDTLKAFVGHRHDLKGGAFSRALNEIFLVFHDSPTIMDLLSAYHDRVTARQSSEDEMIRLFKAMCKDVGMDYAKFNDSFFLRPFNTRQSTMEPAK